MIKYYGIRTLKINLENRVKYKPIRSIIENISKLARNTFSSKKLHCVQSVQPKIRF